MAALVIAEHNHKQLKSATLAAITAAQACSTEIHVLVVGSQCGAVAQAICKIPAVHKVLQIDADHLQTLTAENLSTQILSIAQDYTHILAPATTQGKSTLPRVAAKLDVAQISDVIKVHSADTFERPIYAGNAIATVQSMDVIKVMTIRTTAFDAVVATGGQTTLVEVPALPDTGLSKIIGHEAVQSERPDLTAAKVVVSGGRGLGSGENYSKLIEPLADKLGAALGASRAAVDAGFVPNEYQVGQTGKVVAPQLYLAIGISGAIQHLAGMMDSKVIVAINKDPDAPIFSVADYGLVGDLFEVVPELTNAL